MKKKVLFTIMISITLISSLYFLVYKPKNQRADFRQSLTTHSDTLESWMYESLAQDNKTHKDITRLIEQAKVVTFTCHFDETTVKFLKYDIIVPQNEEKYEKTIEIKDNGKRLIPSKWILIPNKSLTIDHNIKLLDFLKHLRTIDNFNKLPLINHGNQYTYRNFGEYNDFNTEFYNTQIKKHNHIYYDNQPITYEELEKLPSTVYSVASFLLIYKDEVTNIETSTSILSIHRKL